MMWFSCDIICCFQHFSFDLIYRLGVAVLEGKLYACGGYDGSTFLRSVEVFDPKTEKWNHVAPMSVTRSRVALAANAGRLWAVGGYDGTA
jgi:kelch-like protein 18